MLQAACPDLVEAKNVAELVDVVDYNLAGSSCMIHPDIPIIALNPQVTQGVG